MKKLQMLTAYLTRYTSESDFLECANDNQGDWVIFTDNDPILVNALDEGFEVSEDCGKTWKPLGAVSQLKAAIARMQIQE